MTVTMFLRKYYVHGKNYYDYTLPFILLVLKMNMFEVNTKFEIV